MSIQANDILSHFKSKNGTQNLSTGLDNSYCDDDLIKAFNIKIAETPFNKVIPQVNKIYISLDESNQPKCAFTGYEKNNKYIPMNFLTKTNLKQNLNKSNLETVIIDNKKEIAGYFTTDLEKKKTKTKATTRARSTVRSKSNSRSGSTKRGKSSARQNENETEKTGGSVEQSKDKELQRKKTTKKSKGRKTGGGMLDNKIENLDSAKVQTLLDILSQVSTN